MIFISHATPEDNDFARWLSMRLAGAGFRVWSDVTKLIGGERFWTDIEQAIMQDTRKFLLCVSKHASKPGVLKEIDLAIKAETQKRQNIIVPLKLDETAFSAIPRNLGASVNAVRFDAGWAPGLARLLEVLKRDGVQPDNHNGVSIVNEWWRKSFPVTEGIQEGEEICISNLFPISKPLGKIWYHPAGRNVPRGFKGKDLKVIAEPFGNGFVSFCSPQEMATAARRFCMRTSMSVETGWEEFIQEGISGMRMGAKDAHRLAYALLCRGFERHAENRGCQRYALSGEKICHWLTRNSLANDEVSFLGPEGQKQRRALVGFKTMNANRDGVKPKRYWHFAVQGLPTFDPDPGIILKTHVVFTPDGITPFSSDSYQHSARRNQGKGWWNSVWRDRVLAMMSFLADGGKELHVPMADKAEVVFSAVPVRFITEVRYAVVDRQSREDVPDDEDESNELPEDAEDE